MVIMAFFLCRRDSSVCPDRHRLIYHLDQPVLPTTGLIEVSWFISSENHS